MNAANWYKWSKKLDMTGVTSPYALRACRVPSPPVKTGHRRWLWFAERYLVSSMYIRWLIFSCDLLSLYPAVHFLSIWLSGIMAIMNSKGDCASPWKIPLWIFFFFLLSFFLLLSAPLSRSSWFFR